MPSRVDNLQKRKAKAVSKGKDKKAAKLTKKINKSMARQEERGMRKAERQKRKKINDYTKGIKTSGMRKKAKKALGRGAATGAADALGSVTARMGKGTVSVGSPNKPSVIKSTTGSTKIGRPDPKFYK